MDPLTEQKSRRTEGWNGGMGSMQQDGIRAVIERIRDGDRELRERFIEQNIPHIKRTVRKITRSFFIDDSDEYSIALGAFNHAIDRYRIDSGVPFEYFSRLLMRNRLFDWISLNSKYCKDLALDASGSDGGVSTDSSVSNSSVSNGGVPLSERIADPASGNMQLDIEFEDVMLSLKMQLDLFGLDFPKLAGKFPKHRDSRLLCISAARCVSDDELLYGMMLKNRRLPVAELSKRTGMPSKTIERNRSNIIFLALLMRSELQVIKSYIAVFEKEGSK